MLFLISLLCLGKGLELSSSDSLGKGWGWHTFKVITSLVKKKSDFFFFFFCLPYTDFAILVQGTKLKIMFRTWNV